MRGKVSKLIRQEMFNGTKPKKMDIITRNEYRKVKKLYNLLDKNKKKMV